MVLAQAWAGLPDALRTPTQFLGRHYAGCAATIGVMPRCDFTCRGCYLGADANRIRPRSVEDVKAQMRAIRKWLGPAGNLQLTDGEVTLHIDTTMRGRRDGYARATREAELDGLRAEFADLIRGARQGTGRRLEAASTV